VAGTCQQHITALRHFTQASAVLDMKGQVDTCRYGSSLGCLDHAEKLLFVHAGMRPCTSW